MVQKEQDSLTRWHAGLAVVVGLVGVLILVTGLSSQSFLLWDHAYHSIEVRTIRDMVVGAWDWFQGESLEVVKNRVRYEQGGIFPTGVAKPGYIFLLTVLSTILGFQDVTLSILGVLAGVGGLLLVYAIGRDLRNRETGLWAMALLSLAAMQVYLARMGFPNVSAIAFFLLGLYAGFRGRFFLSGLALGFSVTVHYALLINLGVLFLTLIGLTFVRYRQDPAAFKNSHKERLAWMVGLVIFPLLWEIPYQIVEAKLAAYLKDTSFHTYFYYILRQLMMVTPEYNDGTKWQFLFFPLVYFKTQGFFFLPLYLVAFITVVIQLKKKGAWDEKTILIFSQGFLTLLLWVIKPNTVVGRVTALITPFLCLTLAFWLAGFKNKLLKTILFLALILPGLPTIFRVMNHQLGYKEAARFVADQGEKQVVVLVNYPQWQYYLGPKQIYTHHFSFSEDNIKQAVQSGAVRYLTIDYFDIDDDYDSPYAAWTRSIRKKWDPVKKVANAMTCDPIIEFEGGPAIQSPDRCFIEIYDLKQIYDL